MYGEEKGVNSGSGGRRDRERDSKEKDRESGKESVRERERSVLESESVLELDGVIRSMQNVVNDRKRVRRLCRHQQLSIMALR